MNRLHNPRGEERSTSPRSKSKRKACREENRVFPFLSGWFYRGDGLVRNGGEIAGSSCQILKLRTSPEMDGDIPEPA